MLGLLFLVFVVAPLIELYVMAQVAGTVGLGTTILLLVGISVVGAWLAKVAGIGVLNRLQRTVRHGKVPSAEVVDGALILLAGALLIAPGFISDAVAVLLLLPPTRALARGAVLRRIRAGSGLVAVVASGRRPGSPEPTHPVWDVDSWEEPGGPTDPPRLGP